MKLIKQLKLKELSSFSSIIRLAWASDDYKSHAVLSNQDAVVSHAEIADATKHVPKLARLAAMIGPFIGNIGP